MRETEEDKPSVTLDDYIVPQRVTAFNEAYAPATEDMATAAFGEAQLRDFFQAWVNNLGDPLTIYLDRLESLGFRLKVSRSGHLAIFVTNKEVSGCTV